MAPPVRLHQIEGDWFRVSRLLPSNYFHGCVSDFPYLIAMMSREFDRQHRRWPGATEGERAFNWNLGVCREIYRLLVPGAVAMVFQGSRTYHRLAYAAEVAGFEVLPMIVGICGSAMAQGGDVGKLIDREAGAVREVVARVRVDGKGTGRTGGMYGASDPRTTSGAPATPLARDFDGRGTRLRDQAMPVAVLMKPTEGSFASNARRWGVAGFDVDGCRVETGVDRDCPRTGRRGQAYAQDEWTRAAVWNHTGERKTGRGRYPGNVVFDAAAAEEVGEMSGSTSDGVAVNRNRSGAIRASATYGEDKRVAVPDVGYGGSGTAARYFRRFKYIARAPRSERRRGLETWHWVGSKDHPEGWRRVDVEEWQTIPKRRQMIGSNHPTLKALEFTTWVARLVLPPVGPEASRIRMETTGSRARLLVPFSGVGSECIGGGLAGWEDIVACETSGSYVAQTACRWAAWGPYSSERAAEVERTGNVRATHAQRGLFEANPL